MGCIRVTRSEMGCEHPCGRRVRIPIVVPPLQLSAWSWRNSLCHLTSISCNKTEKGCETYVTGACAQSRGATDCGLFLCRFQVILVEHA